MVDFWCRFFSRFGADFFTVYADFSRFIRDINGEKKHLVIDDRFFTVSFSRFAPSRGSPFPSPEQKKNKKYPKRPPR